MLPGYILQKALLLSGRMVPQKHAAELQQKKVLSRLIRQACNTDFGKTYQFGLLQKQPTEVQYQAYTAHVPLHVYENMFSRWWHRVLTGEPDVCWPGYTPYMALTSGTSLGGSKYIPLTTHAICSIRQAGLQMAVSMAQMPELKRVFGLKTLSVGGSTTLRREDGVEVGDFSGIMMKHSPAWYRNLIIPEPPVHAWKNWQQKLDYIVQKAPQWNPGSISGFPVWVVPMLQAIIYQYKLNHIHQLWPGLRLFLHGGMSLAPYWSAFNACLGKPLMLLETYVASEGYLAHRVHPGQPGMQLVTAGGIFFELVPFEPTHFDPAGNLLSGAYAIPIWQASVGKRYAVVLSGNNGAWRYLIGDVVEWVNHIPPCIKWIGRTAHFLNVAGEHLSIGNLEEAFAMASRQMNRHLSNFSVYADAANLPAKHIWWVESPEILPALRELLDQNLSSLNDDYATLRKQHLLGPPQIYFMPPENYRVWMESLGKTDGQHQYPRVVTGMQIGLAKSLILPPSGSEGI